MRHEAVEEHEPNDRQRVRPLEHGQRVTELMKQKQYAPMSVAEMGVSLYAATEGFLEDVEVEKVLDFEAALIAYMHEEHGDFMKEIDESGNHNDDIVATVDGGIEPSARRCAAQNGRARGRPPSGTGSVAPTSCDARLVPFWPSAK